MRLFVILISLLSKTLAAVSRLLKKGSGTSIAGLFIERWFPWVVKYFAKKYEKIIFISGTNGKTTTRQMIVSLFKGQVALVSNYGGANIFRGIAASLMNDLNIWGKPKSSYAIFEVEEATLPKLGEYIDCDILVLTNIARDQLDAYGEIDVTLRYFQTFLERSHCHVVLNADDAKLKELKTQVLIGVKVTNTTLSYEQGRGQGVNILNLLSIEQSEDHLQLSYNSNISRFKQRLSGQYNAVNYALAAAVGIVCNMTLAGISQKLSQVAPVFGRGEIIKTDSSQHTLILVKNPLGFTSALFTYQSTGTVVIGIQDKIADGKDVSWLWDVVFEEYPHILKRKLITSGTRALDIQLRLEQGQRTLGSSQAIQTLTVEQLADYLTSTEEKCIIFGTYTFCMELRSRLEKKLNLAPIHSETF